MSNLEQLLSKIDKKIANFVVSENNLYAEILQMAVSELPGDVHNSPIENHKWSIEHGFSTLSNKDTYSLIRESYSDNGLSYTTMFHQGFFSYDVWRGFRYICRNVAIGERLRIYSPEQSEPLYEV